MAWEPNDLVIEQATAHFMACMPAEGCGVVMSGRFVPIQNCATQNGAFSMDRTEFLAALKTGRLEAIVHSHVYEPPIASQGDRTGCEALAVPWVIISVPTGKWGVIEPCGWMAPLIGRQWCHGSLDCWGLVRDGFKAFTGIECPDFHRDWNWWHSGSNLIVDNIRAAGFVDMGQGARLQHCDIVLMKFRSPVPNHLGLYIAPDGILLHQLHGRMSVREPYGGWYRQITTTIVRHHVFLEDPPPPHDFTDRSIWTGEEAGKEPA